MKKILVLFLSAVMIFSVGALVGCEEHTHTLVKHDAVSATCETGGNSEYYSCACGKYFNDAQGANEITEGSWIISALSHTLVKHDAVPATCETGGNSEYYSCACGKYFADAQGQTEIAKDSWILPALSHTPVKHDAVPATCETGGNSEYYSCACGKYFADAQGQTEIAKDSWILPALSHTLVKHDLVRATCGVEGSSAYYSCECGKFFEDAEGKTEIEKDSWILPALEHRFGDNAKCINGCGAQLTEQEMIALGYIAKANGTYYKALAHALKVGGDVEIIYGIDILTNSDYAGYAFGAWLNNGGLNGNDNVLQMTFNDSDKFTGLWLLEDATGVKNLVVITDTKTAIYVEDLSHEVIIEGVQITTAGSGIHAERCTNVVLKDIEVNSSNVAGYKAAVFAGDGAQVVVESGYYQAEIAILTGGYNGASVTVNGGEFVGKIVVNGDDTLVITGGTFSVDPSKWVSEGYAAKLNADGTWTVVECKEVATTAQLTSALRKGGYVRLTDNVALTSQLTINKETTIDLNGNTLTTSQGAYNKFIMAKSNLDIISSVEGAKIELGNAALLQVSSDYPDSVINIENVVITRTATSGTELVLNYGTLNLKGVTLNLAGGCGVFNTYGDLTLGQDTIINVSGVLGTSLINNNGAVNILIDGATININSFRVFGGALFSRNRGTSFIIEDIELNIVLDETYTSLFLNFVDGVDADGNALVQLKGGIYNVTGASGKYNVSAEGKWVLVG